MALRENLKEEEKQCVEAKDYVELARKALTEPPDTDYALELLESAENEAKFPDDYVTIAEVYSSIGKNEKALELYETAEENAFEPLEFATIAHSIIANLKDAEKSFELYQNALKDVKKVNEIVSILELFAQDFQSPESLEKIIPTLESKFKNFDELQTFLSEFSKKTTETSLIKSILKSYEKKVDGIENYSKFSALIYEVLHDKGWAEEILDEAIDEAKFTKEFLAIAESFNKIGNLDKVKELIQQAKDFSVSPEENYELALAVWKYYNDKDQTAELLKKSYTSLKDKKVLLDLVKFVKSELGNIAFAQEILEFVLQKLNASNEILELILIGKEIFENPEYTKKQFQNSVEKINEPNELLKFAGECFKSTADKEVTLLFFKKALNNASKFEQLLEIAKNYLQIYGTDELLNDIITQTEVGAKSTNEYILLAQFYYESLKNIEKAKNTLEKAEEIVANLNDMQIVTDYVKKYFGQDGEWIARVEEKLTKRKENQKTYDEFQKLEHEAKYLKDFLQLAERVSTELNDKYYVKKLLNNAYELIEKQYLNIENYFKLSKSILSYLNDSNWVFNIFENLIKNRIVFVNDLAETFQKIALLPIDKEKAKELIEKYLNIWRTKTKDTTEALKLANLMLTFKINPKDVEDFLLEFVERAEKFHDYYALIEFSLDNHFNRLQNTLLEKIWNSVHSPRELFEIIELLKKHNFDLEHLVSRYIEYCRRITSEREILELAENYYHLFESYNAEKFFKELKKSSPKEYEEILEKIKSIVLEGKYV